MEPPVQSQTATVVIPPSRPTSSAPDEGRFVPGTLVAGRYRIISLLGRGGMGEVYRATDLTLSQPVALKYPALALAIVMWAFWRTSGQRLLTVTTEES